MNLEIKNLSKNFRGHIAVNDVSFTLEKGVYGLLGANGAGKTTLMRMLCTLIKPTLGSVEYKGENILEMDERYRNIIGYLPQDFGYYPEFSVYDYLIYISLLKGIPKGVAKKRIKELLDIVSLYPNRKNKIKTFSGGMKRRVGIAQALLNNPKILILDEPTAGLDPKERIKFRTLISRISEDKIVLLSTHIVSDIESIAKEILIMKNGNIIVKGSNETLLNIIKDKVWVCESNINDEKEIGKNYLVSNEKIKDNIVQLRIISDEKPMKESISVEPTLEDLFLYYCGEVD